MRNIGCLLLVFAAFISCKERPSKELSTLRVDEPHQILIVIKDKLWYGGVGDSIREYLAVPMNGITPPETLFSLEQVAPSFFQGDLKKSRNIIEFSDDYKENCFLFERSKFTEEQMTFSLFGDSRVGLIDEFKTNVDSIINSIRLSELHLMAGHIATENTLDKSFFLNRFNVTLTVPSAYKLVEEHHHFAWFKKDVASGNSNIMIYDIPIIRIENTKNTVFENLLEVKDSVNGRYVHSVEDNSYLNLNEGLLPTHRHFINQGREAYEIKGVWDMHNSFMNGPYLSFAFRDKESERYLFIQGLVYYPAMGKRSILLEVEAIVKSLKFNESHDKNN